jgi:hypothetical protein
VKVDLGRSTRRRNKSAIRHDSMRQTQRSSTETQRKINIMPLDRRQIAQISGNERAPGASTQPEVDSKTQTQHTGPQQGFGRRVAKESPQRPEESLSRPPPPAAAGGERAKGGGGDSYLGMVMHLVLGSWLAMAFSSSSRPPDFLSFLTRLRTAFSLHLSSHSPFFQPRSRFTIGGENGSIDDISA